MRILFLVVISMFMMACSFEFKGVAASDTGPVGDAGPVIDSQGAIDSSPQQSDAGEVSVTFQRGLNGYTGTSDTSINSSAPDTNYGQGTDFGWDLDETRYALLRFDDIVGPGLSQIPPGIAIESAVISISMIDSTDLPSGAIHAVLVDWGEQSVTYNNFGPQPGVQNTDYGPKLADAPLMMGPNKVEVTSIVQEWINTPASNRGLIVIPGSNNGALNHASESLMTSERPQLVVEYVP